MEQRASTAISRCVVAALAGGIAIVSMSGCATIMHGTKQDNLTFGGLIGLAVDAASGGIYKLTPEQIEGSLQTGHASATNTGDGIYVVAVLAPQPDWVRVAQLQHE